MNMAKLILVKHATPEIIQHVISHRWVLSAEGRRRCDWLADELKTQGIARIYSSLEPKALETAALVAVRLNLPVQPCRNLHENDRTGLGFIARNELQRRLRDFFDQRDQTILGTETANSAFRRFARSVNNIAVKEIGKASAIVTHGTVLSLFVAHYNAIEPYHLWSQLGLPSYVVLDPLSFSLDGNVRNHPDKL